MGMFDSTVGAIFIAVVLNTYLSGIVTYQYGLYWTGKFKDPMWIRLTIAGLCISDMFHSICVAYMGWIYAVESFGNPANLINIFWPFPLSAIMMTFTALTTQQFLIYRLHLLTSSLTLKPHLRLIPAIISTILSLTSLTAFAWGMTVGVKVWLAPSMMHLSEVNGLLTVWLTLEVVVDLVLAALLLATLQSKGTGFKQSDRVLRRLIRLSVQTGLCTAIFALLCMILWLTLPNTHWYLLFGLPISRVYTSTLLDTLLSRQRLRGMLNGSDTYATGGKHQFSNSLKFGSFHGAAGTAGTVSLGTTAAAASAQLQSRQHSQGQYQGQPQANLAYLPNASTGVRVDVTQQNYRYGDGLDQEQERVQEEDAEQQQNSQVNLVARSAVDVKDPYGLMRL